MISRRFFKNDLKKNIYSIPWVLLVISSIFVCVISCGFHFLSFLLTSSTLLLSIFALPHLRPNSNLNSIAQETSLVKEEDEEEEEENPNLRDTELNSDLTQECSDGSISDEESLIEIALPSGSYIDPKKKPLMATKCGIQQKWWTDCYPIEAFKQQSLMEELIAEINEFYEEENMIEIDLSMGLIKCPRFEIKA